MTVTFHGTDGTVSLRPVRVYEKGIDADDLMRQLDRLDVLVEALAERGASGHQSHPNEEREHCSAPQTQEATRT